jgi:hypothetical protein
MMECTPESSVCYSVNSVDLPKVFAELHSTCWYIEKAESSAKKSNEAEILHNFTKSSRKMAEEKFRFWKFYFKYEEPNRLLFHTFLENWHFPQKLHNFSQKRQNFVVRLAGNLCFDVATSGLQRPPAILPLSGALESADLSSATILSAKTGIYIFQVNIRF